MAGSEPTTAGSGRVGDAAAHLAQDTADLVRSQIQSVQGEVSAALRRMGAGGALLAGAGLCGALTVASAHQTALRTLEHVLPRTMASALLTCAYGSAAAALGIAAWDRVQAAADASGQALERAREGIPDAGGSVSGPGAAPRSPDQGP
ncbi:phage holin family protein [Streptomyces sp. NPDC008313]|uniref:phage holin family protein n=1 Tax=Streptomyces sp. NPDC008313 TaxID=3364826 RepID=UPI0036EC20F2